MKSVNTFVVNVSGLVDRPGSTRQVTLAGQVEPALDQVEDCGQVTADLRIEAMAGGVWVRGVARAEMVLRCNRCLDPVGFEAEAPVRQAYGEEARDDMPAIGQRETSTFPAFSTMSYACRCRWYRYAQSPAGAFVRCAAST